MRAKRLQGCLTWIAIFILLFVTALSVFFIAKPDVAYAVRSFADMAAIFARVEIEIMSTTPYGRYYSGLYWKHYEELRQIFSSHPGYREDMHNLMHLYIPNIEATLDGRGNEVHITQRQVDELQAFFSKIMAISSKELQADMEREQTRTPLQDFVGMSMDETLAYIERAWERDFPSQPSPTDTALATKTVTPVP
jgi:hypothetical protein